MSTTALASLVTQQLSVGVGGSLEDMDLGPNLQKIP
jgi:hypothetical protein